MSTFIVTIVSILLVVGFVTMLSLLPRQVRRTIGIIVLGAVCTAVLLGIGFAGANALAEEVDTVVIDGYSVEAIVVNGETLLLVTFPYEGEELSFYWEEELDNRSLQVAIWNGIEVIDADYAE